MLKRLAAAAVLVVGSAAVFWGVSGVQTRPSSPATRSFDFNYLTRIPALGPEAGTLRVWIPVPETDPQQLISGLTIESPVPYVLHRDPEYRNQYAYLEVKPEQAREPFTVRLRFQTLRREHKVDVANGGAAAGARATPAELARWLQPDRLVPLDGMIAALAEQETRGLTRPLDKARALFSYVVSTMRYDKTGEGWGRGDALFACTARKGNCTDFHALFIGMMRASGIPARFEIGFPLPADKSEGQIAGYHCWAQFYLEGVGWIPVDASEAWKNPSKRDYFFGAHAQHRVLFTRGRDIRFNPAQQGEPLNYFVYPYAELDGKAFAGLESAFSFRDLKPAAR